MATELSAGMSFVAVAIVILGRIFSFPYLALAILRRMDYLAEINVRPELSESNIYASRVFTCKIHFENYIL